MKRQVDEMTSFIVMDILEKAQELERKGINIIHLEVGEPDFNLPSNVSSICQKAYLNNQTHYTHSLGVWELREAIAEFYSKEYDVIVNPACVMVTSGSSPAILMALMCLCERDSEVLISNPSYPCYKNFILACHAKPVSIPLKNYQYDLSLIKENINRKTRAIFINSPMNPTGALIKDEVFKELKEIDIPIISDEIYHGLTYHKKAKSILKFTENAFVINGFSKRFSMTGLRLGYMIAPEKYMQDLQILQQNLFICAPSTAQQGAIEALKQDTNAYLNETLSVYNERRLYMMKRLKEIGFSIPTEPEGAFYIYCDARKFTSNSYEFAIDILENAHVGITPGIDFGTKGEGFVRFSYANSMENIQEGLNRIEKYLKTSEEKIKL